MTRDHIAWRDHLTTEPGLTHGGDSPLGPCNHEPREPLVSFPFSDQMSRNVAAGPGRAELVAGTELAAFTAA